MTGTAPPPQVSLPPDVAPPRVTLYGGGQSRRHSATESLCNTLAGLLLSYVLGMLVYPLFGFPVTPEQNAIIVGIFTVASVLRNYVIRRLYNRYGGDAR